MAHSRALSKEAYSLDRSSSLIGFIAIHLGCFAAFWTGVPAEAVILAVVLYVVRVFGITAGFHRYFSHKTFKTSRAFQFVMAVCGLCAIQRGPLWWAAHHRHHHVHSDEHPDLHSPKQHGMLWSHMFWFTTDTVFATNHKNVKDLAKFPEIKFLNRHETLIYLAFAAFVLGLGFLLSAFSFFNTTVMQVFVWGFFISTVFNYHAVYTINSLSHLFGRRRYNTTDTSRNNIWLALLTLGEGWHNNHHHYPSSVRQGFYWWEIDITYYVLKMMSWTGLIWDLRGVPEKKLLGNRLA